ncbi:MAG: hypothetical protein ABJA93_12540, partial [Sporichthyaceae bacterium]
MSWPMGTCTPTLVAHREENPYDPGTPATLGPQRPARLTGRRLSAAPAPAAPAAPASTVGTVGTGRISAA